MNNYTVRLVKQALQDFHVRTDIWFAAVSVVAGAFAGPGQSNVANLTGNDIAIFVLVTVVAFTALRLFVFAPYALWNEAQADNIRLQAIIDSSTFKQREKALEAQEGDRAELLRELSGLVDWIGGAARVAFHGDETRRRLEKYALRFMGDSDFWMHWDLLSTILVQQGHYTKLVEIGAFHQRWHNELLSLNTKTAEHHIRCLIAILSGIGPARIDHEKLDEFQKSRQEIYDNAKSDGVILQEHLNILS